MRKITFSRLHDRFRSQAIFFCAALAALFQPGCGDRQKAGAGGGDDVRILNYTIGNDISNMDPAQITDIESALVAAQVYQGLVRFKEDSVEIEPELAESHEVSPDGLTWTFRLKQGVRFHDGTEFDADAVVFSVMRQMDSNHPYHVPGKMRYSKLLFGDPESTEAALVRDVNAADKYTVVFTLARPFVPFEKNLAMVSAAIVSPKAVQTYGRDFNTTMSGTGPFRIRSYRQDQSIVLVKNEDFHEEAAPLDEIRFRILRDANVRLNSIRKGDSDIIAGVEPTAMDLLRKDENIVLLEEPSMNLGYIAMNNAHPPLDNKLVRQALNYAVDKEYIANTLFVGTSIPAKGVIPPGMLGYDPEREGYPHDPERARLLLAEAGYPNGFDVRFSTHDRTRVYNPVGAKLAERIQKDLEVVGVRAVIDQMEFPTFLAKQKSSEYQIANSGWVTDNGDPDNFIYELAGREDNDTNYSNPEATRLMREAASERDEKRREELYRKAEGLVVEDPPFIFLNHGKQVLAHRKRVKNFHAHPTAVSLLYKVDVDSD